MDAGILGLIVILVYNCVITSGNEQPQTSDTFYRHMVPKTRIQIKDSDTKTGYILSPGYPGSFPVNSSSYVNLKSNLEQVVNVRIIFEDLDLELSNYCRTESVTIYCSPRIRPLLTICGSRLPEVLTLYNCEVVTLNFFSDAFNHGEGRGFMIRFEFFKFNDISELCPDNEFRCRNRRCIPRSLLCNQVDDCGDASDEDSKTPCSHLPTIPYSIDYTCGLSSLSNDGINELPQNRIVGGETVNLEGSWPFQVSIQNMFFESVAQACGATLIHPLYVLTAAHCLWEPYTQYRLVFGSQNLRLDSWPDINNYVQVRYINKVHAFPSPNDIALVELNAPVLLTPYVRPVCLPHQDEPVIANQLCYTTGFGVSRGTGDVLSMKRLLQRIKHPTACQAPYSRNFHLDDYSQICTDNDQGNGVCSGDSGGPLTCPDKHRENIHDGKSQSFGRFQLVDEDEYMRIKERLGKPVRYTIFGILNIIAGGSGSYPYCGFKHVPAIYTRVSIFIEWIMSVMFKDIRSSSNKQDRDHLRGIRAKHFGYMFRTGHSRHINFTKPSTRIDTSY